MRYRYSRWRSDGGCGVETEEVLAAYTDELLDCSVDEVLAAVARSGITAADGSSVPGIDALIERIDDERASILSSAAVQSALAGQDDTTAVETHEGNGCLGDRRPPMSTQAGPPQPDTLTGTGADPRGVPSVPGTRGSGLGTHVQPSANRPTVGVDSDSSMQTDGRSVLGNDPTLDRSSRTSTGARTEEWEAGGTENSGTAQAEADQSAALKAGEPSAETSDTSVLAIDVDHPRVLSIEDLLTRLSDLTALRVALDSARAGGELAGVNLDSVRRLLGADAEEACVWLATLRARLHASGYLSNNGASDTLTPAALRRIGGVLVDRLFATVGRDRPGEHRARRPAPGIDLTDDLRPYRFGDRFTLDIHQTLMNAVKRGGSAVPVHLRSDDFVVNDAEETQMATTVLLLDLSRSMPLRGCFLAARKLAIALHALIQARYPRDRLHILGFTAGVEELDPLSLASLRHAEGAHGTNVQAALASARRLLGRHRSGNRQIVLITDGEPTAHTDSGGVHLAYPPVEATLHFTLREVRHCRLDGIVVNTVMLGRTAAAIDFVSTMTEVGGGHAFFATADRLDSIVLHQYVNWRRSSASAIP